MAHMCARWASALVVNGIKWPLWGPCKWPYKWVPGIITPQPILREEDVKMVPIFCWRILVAFHHSYGVAIFIIYIYIPGTRNKQFKIDVWWNNHFLCKELVHHPIETTTNKWMFEVPGINYILDFIVEGFLFGFPTNLWSFRVLERG